MKNKVWKVTLSKHGLYTFHHNDGCKNNYHISRVTHSSLVRMQRAFGKLASIESANVKTWYN